MSTPRTSSPSRRGILAAGGALGIGAFLTACGGGGSKDSDDSASGSGSGPWTFKDDRGTTVKADKTPKKVVAFTGTAAALHDFGFECAGVFGPTKLKDGKPDPQAGDLDVDKVTVLGNAWGEFNVEKYAAMSPELLVTNMLQAQDLWYVPDDSKKKILGLAPSVGLNVTKVSLTQVIGRYAELAGSLGADLKAKKVTDAKARFEKASETLRKAAKAKKGLKVLCASGSADLLYVSEPSVYADLTYFKQLGVDFIVPDKVTGGFFESLSWENAGKYAADLILLDNRTSALQPKDLESKPTWAGLPAVKAGQITPWLSEPRYSYAGCAPLLEGLAAAIEKAKKVS
ncbi:ABC transporter substrate-binding protein [Streptomyces netropsis]|uniref:Iron complex transport system substrate-binding protein n=1 Tax=Streptomyces netropsis TaxID=55404 RepID=A0A7W7LAJ9_STRNE|nr:ABC transporter substrate-binding protein [Streptomyces netropsis]MBB4886688.1 iron complex transport system substrate-binding protein [Streptomyces netropsis]GGR21920.1 ABC transporter substrate-binding protein [Streptomyces netropsis]